MLRLHHVMHLLGTCCILHTPHSWVRLGRGAHGVKSGEPGSGSSMLDPVFPPHRALPYTAPENDGKGRSLGGQDYLEEVTIIPHAVTDKGSFTMNCPCQMTELRFSSMLVIFNVKNSGK